MENEYLAYLSNTWALSENDALTEEVIKNKLYQQLKYLLENDMQRLVQAMYRLDVKEEKFRDAFDAKSIEEIAQQLVEIVWERELWRWELRKKYSKK